MVHLNSPPPGGRIGILNHRIDIKLPDLANYSPIGPLRHGDATKIPLIIYPCWLTESGLCR